MATLSVRSLTEGCLKKTAPLSVLRDVLCVFAKRGVTRSLKEQLLRIRDRPFVRVAFVTIKGVGQYEFLQIDLDAATRCYEHSCTLWVYGQASITVDRPDLYELTEDELSELYSVGRDLGADIVCYYIQTPSGPFQGYAEEVDGKLGIQLKHGGHEYVFAHELAHLLTRAGHRERPGNLMRDSADYTGDILTLTEEQCQKMLDHPAVEFCGE